MRNNFGKTATDKLTGFTGTVSGGAQYITGCDQYLVQPKCSEDSSKLPESTWFDENRLEFEDSTEAVVIDTSEKKGACGIAPRK